jgi:hypothetical protein
MPFTADPLILTSQDRRDVTEISQARALLVGYVFRARFAWLNQVEIWFAKIEREVIARDVFTSVTDLARKLRRYINVLTRPAPSPFAGSTQMLATAFVLTVSLRQSN